MKITSLKNLLVFVLLSVAFAFLGCNTTQNTNTNASNKSTSNNAINANTANANNEDASPASVLRTYFKAINKKDVAEMKKNLSQAALKWLEEDARKNKETVDEILTRIATTGKGDSGNIEYNTVWQNDERALVNPRVDGKEHPTGIVLSKEGNDWKVDFHLMWELMAAIDKATESGNRRKVIDLYKDYEKKHGQPY